MKKKDFSPREAWNTLLAEERLLKQTRARNGVIVPLANIFLTICIWIATFVVYFGTLAPSINGERVQDWLHLPFLWKAFYTVYEKAEEPLLCYLLTTGIAFLGILILAVLVTRLLRLISKFSFGFIKESEEELPEDLLKALSTIVKKAETVQYKPRDKYLSQRITAWVSTLGLLGIVFLACSIAHKNEVDTSLYIDMGVSSALYAVFSFIAAAIVRRSAVIVPKDLQAPAIATTASSLLKEEGKKRNEAKKEKDLSDAIRDAADLFSDGKYVEARKRLNKVSKAKIGDIVAILLLTDTKGGETLEGLRRSYDELWKAKDLGFRDERIRGAVELALSEVTPRVKEAAEADMLSIFQSFLNDKYGSVVEKAKPHSAYGHPDAIVLELVSLILWRNDPDKYPEWLEKIKLAKRRGIAEFGQEITEEIIGKLEVAIRQNEEYERKRKAEERHRAETWTPSGTAYPSSGIPGWAEASGWYDFRTGEPLYRVDGRIVNANGEEVSVAWWD